MFLQMSVVVARLQSLVDTEILNRHPKSENGQHCPSLSNFPKGRIIGSQTECRTRPPPPKPPRSRTTGPPWSPKPTPTQNSRSATTPGRHTPPTGRYSRSGPPVPDSRHFQLPRPPLHCSSPQNVGKVGHSQPFAAVSPPFPFTTAPPATIHQPEPRRYGKS